MRRKLKGVSELLRRVHNGEDVSYGVTDGWTL